MNDLIEIETGQPVSATVIWLHGLGADGNDFVPVVPALPLASEGIRFLFPHAPVRPVTVNGGMPMRSWYDIFAMGRARHVDEEQLQQSSERILDLVRQECERGIDPGRIVLIGFSQGGAVAYQSALCGPYQLGGAALLSTYRVNAERFTANPDNVALPLLCAHGLHDDVVPLELGWQGYESLQSEGFQPQWHEFSMGHEVSMQEIEVLGQWLNHQLAPKTPAGRES